MPKKKIYQFLVQIKQGGANQWSLPAKCQTLEDAIEEASALFKQHLVRNIYIDVRIAKLP